MVSHVVGGGEPPAGFAVLNCFEDGAFADFGFAETATTGNDLKTGCTFQNFLLVGMRIGQMD